MNVIKRQDKKVFLQIEINLGFETVEMILNQIFSFRLIFRFAKMI